jgi:hypothetical protein
MNELAGGFRANKSIDTDVLSAGFAGLLSAGHLQLQGLPHLCQTDIRRD